MSFFYLFIYFIVIANIFLKINRLEPSFTDSVFRFRFRFRDSVSVSGFRIPFFSTAGFTCDRRPPPPRLSQGLDDRPHPPPSPLHLSEGLNPPLQAVHGCH